MSQEDLNALIEFFKTLNRWKKEGEKRKLP